MKAANILWGEAVRQRPGRYDEAVLATAATALARDLIESCSGIKEDSFEQMVSELRSALTMATGSRYDGYRIARELEDSHRWECDARMVNVLDGGHVDSALRQHIEEWVQGEGIKPSLKIGDAVRVTGLKGITYDGEVVSIDEKDATYVVCVPALGHVREGIGTHGMVLSFECVEEENPPSPQETK